MRNFEHQSAVAGKIESAYPNSLYSHFAFAGSELDSFKELLQYQGQVFEPRTLHVKRIEKGGRIDWLETVNGERHPFSYLTDEFKLNKRTMMATYRLPVITAALEDGYAYCRHGGNYGMPERDFLKKWQSVPVAKGRLVT
jgi:hypothetical protein